MAHFLNNLCATYSFLQEKTFQQSLQYKERKPLATRDFFTLDIRQFPIFCKTPDAVEIEGERGKQHPVIGPKASLWWFLSLLSSNMDSKMYQTNNSMGSSIKPSQSMSGWMVHPRS